MSSWFWYAVAAAILYGAHQVFTRLAAERIGDGLGGFVVEASAALSILLYLAVLWFARTLESEIQRGWIQLFAVHRNLRWGRDNCVLFALPKRWATFRRARNPRPRRRHHGRRRDSILS